MAFSEKSLRSIVWGQGTDSTGLHLVLVYFALSGLGGSMQNPDNLAKNQQLICPSTYTGATQLTANPAFVANNLAANGTPAYFLAPVAKAKTATIPTFVATLSQHEFSVFLANRQINNQGPERNTVPTKPVKTIFG